MILSVDEENTAMDTFKKFQVDGMIVFAESSHTISQGNIPLVAYGVSRKTNVNYPIIDANHEKSMEIAVTHLYDFGHRDIAYVGLLDTEDALQIEKVEGYQKAMKKLKLKTRTFDTGGLNWFDGYRAVDNLLSDNKRPTAIIGGSYDISGGILRALQEKNIEIPKDISLVSYDNIPQMETMEVPMTCIGVPVDELAEEIVDAIIERIEVDEEIELVKKLTPSLTVRQSAGPSPK
ncbi:transcriptional regulator [Gracilibacillus boraciitolerans JCM 21714]|uniref:Transcriptional regulator n=1 Tax=Gracilibacillus boraciitolerans JCM 21714 TaxID=1298598 RepID=W4VHD8_9BACI|nr:substrate-binding domain-containing protein [Gracilibacillus boraciitolerans]GAE92174.1 transcriptional regulator [Gracilibacillus boraciitolerans JCM 21714]